MPKLGGNISKFLLGCGLAMAVSIPAADAGGFKVLYSFKGGSDGVSPTGISKKASGYRYGVTSEGGTNNKGTIYEIGPGGVETVLHTFAGGSDGASPDGALIKDKAGNLYGTTYYGGASNAGTVYKMAGGTETVLYSFTGGSDGANPVSSLMEDNAGNLYGTTPYGGADALGVVFELAPDGTETVLHTFTGGGDAAFPYAGLIKDKAGNFYGTGSAGGADGQGAMFKLAPGGTETVLYSFAGGSDGAIPSSTLILDKAGNLYGTTYEGGGGSCGGGCGIVFKVAPDGTETVLHVLAGGTSDGSYPYAGVVMDKAGNLYGTAYEGGTDGYGVIFQLAPDGSETLLYSFTGGTDGANPDANLVENRKGVLFSTAATGGANGYGTVFSLPE